MSLTVTADQIRSFNPCDSESSAQIDALMGGNAAVDATYIMGVNIPSAHKLWLLLRPELIEQSQLDTIDAYLMGMLNQSYSKFTIASKCATINVYGHVKAFYAEAKKDASTLDDTILAYVQSVISQN